MNKLEVYRKKHDNLTQKELAKKLGVSYSTIAKVENGVRKPSYDLMEKISSFFQVTVDDIFFTHINH